MARKSYDIKEKRNFVVKVGGYISAGYSQQEACYRIGISTQYYRRWVKVVKKVDRMNASGEFVQTRPMGRLAKSTLAERVFSLQSNRS
jgi:hypothetical protein